ncbi:MAG: hypothetical protein AAGN35_13185 [Bacteroidota bacterium]
MGKLFTVVILLLSFSFSKAQFSTNKIEVRLGYNLHNVHAKRFNYLVNSFNDERYPHIVSQNLPNLNWMHGLALGVEYAWRDDLQFHAVLKSRRQYIEAPYVDPAWYRSYLFRQHTLELGGSWVMKEEGRFSHRIGGGLLLGVLGVFTDWSENSGYEGSRDMATIDHNLTLGLSLHYEARYHLHENVHFFLRPVAQYSLNSQVRRLTDFFAPQVVEGEIVYGTGAAVKYDIGSLSGLGLEGGIVFVLPEL